MTNPPSTPVATTDRRTTTRRRFLALGTGGAVAALAGCSSVLDAVGSLVLQDVNVFNAADRRLAGSVEVTGPDGETVLDEDFDVAPNDAGNGTGSANATGGGSAGNATDGEATETATDDSPSSDDAGNATADGVGTDDEDQSVAVYDDVFAGAGEYAVATELDDGSEIDGQSTAEGTVEVADPENEHVVVALDPDDADEAVVITVIEKLSDLENVETDG